MKIWVKMKKNQAVYFKYLLGNKYIYNCAICRRAAHKAIGANILFCFIFYLIFWAIELFYFYLVIFI